RRRDGRQERAARLAEAVATPARREPHDDHAGRSGGRDESTGFRICEHRLDVDAYDLLNRDGRRGEQPARVASVAAAEADELESRVGTGGEPRPELRGGPVVLTTGEHDGDAVGEGQRRPSAEQRD